MVGGSPGSTVTVKRQTSLLPQRSSAVQVTMLVPQKKKLPEGGSQVTALMPLLSVAAGAGKMTGRPQPPAGLGQADTTMLEGHWITGGSVSSRTVTVKVQLSALPQVSETRQVTGVTPTGKGEPGGGTQISC